MIRTAKIVSALLLLMNATELSALSMERVKKSFAYRHPWFTGWATSSVLFSHALGKKILHDKVKSDLKSLQLNQKAHEHYEKSLKKLADPAVSEESKRRILKRHDDMVAWDNNLRAAGKKAVTFFAQSNPIDDEMFRPATSYAEFLARSKKERENFLAQHKELYERACNGQARGICFYEGFPILTVSWLLAFIVFKTAQGPYRLSSWIKKQKNAQMPAA